MEGHRGFFFFFSAPIARHSNTSLAVCKTTAHYLHACGDATQQYWPVGFIGAHGGAVIATTLDPSHISDLLAFCLPRVRVE